MTETLTSPVPPPTRALTLELLHLSYPLLITNLSFWLIGTTDTLFMGQLGTATLAAVGLGNVIFWTLFLLPRGIVNAVIVFVSQSHGAADSARVNRWLATFVFVALLLAPVVLVYVPLTPLLLEWSGAASDVQQLAVTYIHVRLLEIPFTLVSTALLGYLIGKGDTRTPMLMAFLVVGLNIFFNWVFVFGNLGAPRLGIGGSALASAISQAIGALVTAGVIYHWHVPDFRLKVPSKAELIEIWRVGGPLGLMECVEVSAFTAFLAVIARISTDALAASQIGNQISAFAFLPGFALGTATSSVVGRFIGAKSFDIAARVGYLGVWLGMAWMGVIGVVFWVLAESLARIFSKDDGVVALTTNLLRLMCFYQLFDAINIVFRSALAGAGDTRFTAIITVVLAWLVMVGGSVLLVTRFKLGLLEAWLAPFAYLTLLAVIYWWRWRSGAWQLARVS